MAAPPPPTLPPLYHELFMTEVERPSNRVPPARPYKTTPPPSWSAALDGIPKDDGAYRHGGHPPVLSPVSRHCPSPNRRIGLAHALRSAKRAKCQHQREYPGRWRGSRPGGGRAKGGSAPAPRLACHVTPSCLAQPSRNPAPLVENRHGVSARFVADGHVQA